VKKPIRRVHGAVRLELLAVVSYAAAAGFAEAQAPTHAGQYEQADIEYGAQLYSGHCVVCHGERGDAMPGANLGSGRFKHAETDRDLTNVIRNGVPGTAMAPSAYTESELGGLVAFLRNMSSVNLSAVKLGDAARGRALFVGKGNCGSCHRVGAEGPRAAPDLTAIGAIRTAATLERSLLDPDAALLPANRPVRVELRDGTVINGRRLNEDTFTVQLVDSTGRLVSLDRASIREYEVGTQATMPSYENALTADERADLVAYLLSLKGQN
jgi:putative heme-binding domain-containing protein